MHYDIGIIQMYLSFYPNFLHFCIQCTQGNRQEWKQHGSMKTKKTVQAVYFQHTLKKQYLGFPIINHIWLVFRQEVSAQGLWIWLSWLRCWGVQWLWFRFRRVFQKRVYHFRCFITVTLFHNALTLICIHMLRRYYISNSLFYFHTGMKYR